jgi:hypothetical protein
VTEQIISGYRSRGFFLQSESDYWRREARRWEAVAGAAILLSLVLAVVVVKLAGDVL